MENVILINQNLNEMENFTYTTCQNRIKQE